MNKVIYKLLEGKKKFTFNSQGYSMYPILRSGDVISYEKIKFKSCRINDIVMFLRSGRLVTHRIIYKSQNYLICKGDNNLKADGKIKPEELIAKAVKIKREKKIIDPEDMYLLQSTLYFQIIVKIKKAFENENIDYVILKGLPLYLFFEKTIPRRIYADCDLLIKLNDYEKADKLFILNGFRKINPAYSLFHKILKDKETEISYIKKVNGFPVVFDIHFEPLFLMNQLGRLDALYPQHLIMQMTEEFLKYKRKVNIHNENFFILNTPNLILYLSLHFFHHNFRGIFRLELIAKILKNKRNPDDVLKQFNDKSEFYKVRNMVFPVLIYLNRYFADPSISKFIKSQKPNRNKINFINKNILNKNLFDDERRIEAGLNRFMNLFYLSDEPFWRRMSIFIFPSVIYSVFWTVCRKVILRGKLFYLQANIEKIQ